jgi:hypothetical protein
MMVLKINFKKLLLLYIYKQKYIFKHVLFSPPYWLSPPPGVWIIFIQNNKFPKLSNLESLAV